MPETTAYGLTLKEEQSITRAAIYEHEGKPAMAEAARYAGNYHNMDTREDCDE